MSSISDEIRELEEFLGRELPTDKETPILKEMRKLEECLKTGGDSEGNVWMRRKRELARGYGSDIGVVPVKFLDRGPVAVCLARVAQPKSAGLRAGALVRYKSWRDAVNCGWVVD